MAKYVTYSTLILHAIQFFFLSFLFFFIAADSCRFSVLRSQMNHSHKWKKKLSSECAIFRSLLTHEFLTEIDLVGFTTIDHSSVVARFEPERNKMRLKRQWSDTGTRARQFMIRKNRAFAHFIRDFCWHFFCFSFPSELLPTIFISRAVVSTGWRFRYIFFFIFAFPSANHFYRFQTVMSTSHMYYVAIKFNGLLFVNEKTSCSSWRQKRNRKIVGNFSKFVAHILP